MKTIPQPDRTINYQTDTASGKWKTIPQPDRTINQPADTATGRWKNIPQPDRTINQPADTATGRWKNIPQPDRTIIPASRYSNRKVECHPTTRQNHNTSQQIQQQEGGMPSHNQTEP
jgi:hypothetical protein